MSSMGPPAATSSAARAAQRPAEVRPTLLVIRSGRAARFDHGGRLLYVVAADQTV